MRSVNIRLIKNTQDEGDKIMYEIMSADEAIRLIRDVTVSVSIHL